MLRQRPETGARGGAGLCAGSSRCGDCMIATRFTPRIKHHIVRDYLEGKDVSGEMLRHNIGWEELHDWCDLWSKGGIKALRATRVQAVRKMA